MYVGRHEHYYERHYHSQTSSGTDVKEWKAVANSTEQK